VSLASEADSSASRVNSTGEALSVWASTWPVVSSSRISS
jgi:hypothetical protein